MDRNCVATNDAGSLNAPTRGWDSSVACWSVVNISSPGFFYLACLWIVVLLIIWHILVQIIWRTRSFLAFPADPGSV
jgi:hypothetical protein